MQVKNSNCGGAVDFLRNLTSCGYLDPHVFVVLLAFFTYTRLFFWVLYGGTGFVINTHLSFEML